MRESHGQTPAETFTPEQTRAMEWLSGISDLEKSPLITVDDMRELLVATRGNFPGDESGETAFLSTVADGLRGSMYPGVYLELLPQESAQKVVDDLAARNARAAKMVKKPQDKEKIFESSSRFAQELPDDLRERYATSLKQSMNRKNNNALRGYEKGKRYSPGMLRRMGSKVMSIAGIPLRPIKSAVIERELHREFKNRTGMGYVRSTLRHGIRHTRLQRSFGTDWRHVSESDAPHFSHKTEHHLRHALFHHYGQWAWPSAEPAEIGSRMKSNSKDIATFLGRATKQGGVDLPENFEIPQSLPKQNQMAIDLKRLVVAAFGDSMSAALNARRDEELSQNPSEDNIASINQQHAGSVARLNVFTENLQRIAVSETSLGQLRSIIIDYFSTHSIYQSPASTGKDLDRENPADRFVAAAARMYFGE